jgi:hypothetical protein
MEPRELRTGDIVQISPEVPGTGCFGGCLMIVTEPKIWGAQGVILGPRSDAPTTEPAGHFYYRATWDRMQHTGGVAHWIPGSQSDDDN